MVPADLAHLVTVTDPQLHPDGRRVAFVRTSVDVDEDRYRSTIWIHDGDASHPFTSGIGDRSPAWSPDGAQLAFIRTPEGDDAQPQVHVMAADGGEAYPVTESPLGATGFAWFPDGRSLLVLGKRWIDELADLDAEERARRPRRITTLPYRADGGGWIHERVVDLLRVTLPQPGQPPVEPEVLSSGRYDRGAPAVSGDGTQVAFVARPDDAAPTDPGAVPYLLSLDDRTPQPLAGAGMWADVRFLDDGHVLLTGLEDVFDWPGSKQLYRREEGGGLVSLTSALDRDVVPGAPPCATVGPRPVPGGVLIAAEGRGRTGVVAVRGLDAADGPTIEELLDGPRCVTGFAVSDDGRRIVATVTDVDTPGELIEVVDGQERTLTAIGDELRTHVEVAPTRRLTVERDGVDLDVWAVTPPGFDAAGERTVPVMLSIHGGPTSQYGDYFFDEFQIGAGDGYLVVGTNPRGSSGRGTEWARAVVGAWGEHGSVDTLDLEAVLDGVCDQFPQADPDRAVIMGGSYGGYATARIIARTDRYRAAIVERGLLQWESFSGTSDIGPYFDRMFLAASVDDDPDLHAAASPVRTAASVTTPTLVLHSEADWRCPIEQGEQYFAALQRAGVPSEFVRFPGEGHELTRSGAPKHRIERFDIVLEWCRRWVDHA